MGIFFKRILTFNRILFQKGIAFLPKIFRKVYIIGVRFFETLNLLPKGVNLFFAVLSNSIYGGILVNTFSLIKKSNTQRFGGEIGNDFPFPCVNRVENLIRF